VLPGHSSRRLHVPTAEPRVASDVSARASADLSSLTLRAALPRPRVGRFTLDTRNFITAVRLFVGDPVWTPWNRKDEGVDAMEARKVYVEELGKPGGGGDAPASSATAAA
jgi:hypothetical protein